MNSLNWLNKDETKIIPINSISVYKDIYIVANYKLFASVNNPDDQFETMDVLLSKSDFNDERKFSYAVAFLSMFFGLVNIYEQVSNKAKLLDDIQKFEEKDKGLHLLILFMCRQIEEKNFLEFFNSRSIEQIEEFNLKDIKFRNYY